MMLLGDEVDADRRRVVAAWGNMWDRSVGRRFGTERVSEKDE